MINSWQCEAAVTLKFVAPTMLLAALRNVSDSTFEADLDLSDFDWSTFVLVPKPRMRISMSITQFADCNCVNMIHDFLILESAPNPFVLNDVDCSAGDVKENVTFFYRATSCGLLNAAISRSVNSLTCDPESHVDWPVGVWFPKSDGDTWILVKCYESVNPNTPTPPDTSLGASSGVTSSAVVAGSVIGAVACKPRIITFISNVMSLLSTSNVSGAVAGIVIAAFLHRNRSDVLSAKLTKARIVVRVILLTQLCNGVAKMAKECCGRKTRKPFTSHLSACWLLMFCSSIARVDERHAQPLQRRRRSASAPFKILQCLVC
jgi:hypothetical protein